MSFRTASTALDDQGKEAVWMLPKGADLRVGAIAAHFDTTHTMVPSSNAGVHGRGGCTSAAVGSPPPPTACACHALLPCEVPSTGRNAMESLAAGGSASTHVRDRAGHHAGAQTPDHDHNNKNPNHNNHNNQTTPAAEGGNSLEPDGDADQLFMHRVSASRAKGLRLSKNVMVLLTRNGRVSVYVGMAVVWLMRVDNVRPSTPD